MILTYFQKRKVMQEVRNLYNFHNNNHDIVGKSDEDKTIMKEWETHMKDFVPEDMMTFEIAGSSNFTMFQVVHTVPSYIRGAFFVSHTAKSHITFAVR